MQLKRQRPHGRTASQDGYALVVVLIVVLAISGVVAASQLASRTEHSIAANTYLNTRAAYAAEAGAEKLLASIVEKMADGPLTPEAVAEASSTPPKIAQFTFTEYTADLDTVSSVTKVMQGTFAGLNSLSQLLSVRSSVEGPSTARATVELAARVQLIPLFQFASFYDADLEILPGPRMDLEGRVHTNGELYIDGGTGLYLWNMVTAAGDLHLERKSTGGSDGLRNYIRKNDESWVEILKDTHDFGGDDNPATFPSEAQDLAFDQHSEITWDHRIQTRASGVEPLRLPIPKGVDPYSLIEPCTGAEPTSVATIKFACQAGLVIRVHGDMIETVDGSGTPVTLTNPNALSFAKNAFYDDREQSSNSGDAITGDNFNSNRDVIELNVTNLIPAKGEYGGGIIYVTADPSLPGFGMAPRHEQQYVVRVRGKVLHEPLTVATNLPLYVWGDYNDTGAWKPAAFASDAITILSTFWDDADSGEGKTEGKPVNTAVHAAFLSGHSPTPFHGSPQGGGQMENYPRFLEDWSDRTLTIYGSFVSLWFPRVALAPWACCQYYVPPRRDWHFDQRFLEAANLPPGTPMVGQVVKLGYRRRY